MLVRVYGDDGPRLNELVEIVGVVGGGLTTTGLEVTEEDDALTGQRMEDEQAWDPPTSKVARFHALSWRGWTRRHPVPPGVLDASTADSIRIALLERLSMALDGDSIGAEYALCALLASVDKRKDGRAVGRYRWACSVTRCACRPHRPKPS